MSFDLIFELEKKLSEFTGAPYVVATDCCTHAMELSMRYHQPKLVVVTPFTYISVVMMLQNANIDFVFADDYQQDWHGEYKFTGSNIWDSARRLEPNMFRSNQVQCLSFGRSKPLEIGRLGAILTDDEDFFYTASRWRSDGRDLRISPWQEQLNFGMGYHYCPTLETCATAIDKLSNFNGSITEHKYPDLRLLNFENNSATI